MIFAIFFWILMLLWLVAGGLAVWGPGSNQRYVIGSHTLLLFLLLLLLGWKLFGGVFKGG